jgi:hypothetical protein
MSMQMVCSRFLTYFTRLAKRIEARRVWIEAC